MHLSAGDTAALARKVWLDKDFWTVNFELAVGAGLRAAGLSVVYERAQVVPAELGLDGAVLPSGAYVSWTTDQSR